MHAFLHKDKLVEPLALAASVVAKKSSRAILLHVLLSARIREGRGVLEIVATDESTTYSIELDAEISKEGSLAAPARDLFEIVRSLKSDNVELSASEEDGHTLAIKQNAGKIRFELRCLSADDFPEIEKREEGTWVRFAVGDFMKPLEQVAYAVSHDEARYYLGGVFLEQDKEQQVLRLVATDGHRLAMAEIKEAPSLPRTGAILPSALIAALRKFVAGQEQMEIHLSEKRVAFRIKGSTLEGLLVEGSFPDYRQVIPVQFNLRVRVGRMEMLAALRRIMLCSPEKTGGLRFLIQEDVLTISSQNTGKSQAKEELKLAEMTGDSIEMGFNGAYFVDALSRVDTAEVWLSFTNYLSPCLLQTTGEDNTVEPTPLAVLMPMRL